jgi:FkbH-like protein
MNVALLSNFSTQFLSKELYKQLSKNFESVNVHEVPFGNWELAARNCDPEFSTFQSSSSIICLSLNLLDPDVYSGSSFEHQILQTIEFFQSWYEGDVFMCSIDYPEAAIGNSDIIARVNEINNYFLDNSERQGYRYIDLTSLILAKGLDVWSPGKYLSIAGFHCHPSMYKAIASKISGNIRANINRLARLVVVDLDNTLWSGIVGDCGVENLEISVMGEGNPHRRLQNFLVDLHSKGVILAACSKNEYETVKAVFDTRKDMVIQESHFSCIKANWNPKSENIKDILDELNLTAPGTVFLDDSSFERNEVSTALPEIIVPDLPEDPQLWTRFIDALNVFVYPSVTKEDRGRNRFYKHEKARMAEKQKSTPVDFLQGLQLRMRRLEINPRNSGRALTLINKTNQFNVNGQRHELPSFNTLLDEKDVYSFSYALEDKYSDYGEISVLIGQRQGQVLNILAWVLSCRAFGRGVENAIIQDLVLQAKADSLTAIECRLIYTSKNKPTLAAMEQIGFCPEVSDEKGTLFSLNVGAEKLKENFVDMKREGY